MSRKERADPAVRGQALQTSLTESGVLAGILRIPDTVGDVTVTADLRAGTLTCHVDVDAPKNGRPTTRVNWLVKQLKNTPPTTRIEAFVLNQRGPGAAELLSVVRETPVSLVQDPARELKSFRVALSVPMGTKRGRGRGAFIDSVIEVVDDFYEQVVQHLKAWAAAPPRMRPEVESPVDEPDDLTSTALSSQDEPQPDVVGGSG